jgi:hypothetical protein
MCLGEKLQFELFGFLHHPPFVPIRIGLGCLFSLSCAGSYSLGVPIRNSEVLEARRWRLGAGFGELVGFLVYVGYFVSSGGLFVLALGVDSGADLYGAQYVAGRYLYHAGPFQDRV